MNTLRGGGETDTIVVFTDDCTTDSPDCPIPASDDGNLCSDGCIVFINTGGQQPWLCMIGTGRE
ncbi:hypothetical protein H2O64_13290 [Kordia sp. YSTF-M3]|uniref:Uncharacterized protein n=1 Tax=Kordia aestuariivivens TaxID=2759037 RepID=A0ABR7QBB3_9FLAO|nr:hypothetical protein [Kordia aestuariivivens]MBC8755646.1 hypothetical protein [Kordia aestuariivivens]